MKIRDLWISKIFDLILVLTEYLEVFVWFYWDPVLKRGRNCKKQVRHDDGVKELYHA
jgi:hypothetical protein